MMDHDGPCVIGNLIVFPMQGGTIEHQKPKPMQKAKPQPSQPASQAKPSQAMDFGNIDLISM